MFFKWGKNVIELALLQALGLISFFAGSSKSDLANKSCLKCFLFQELFFIFKSYNFEEGITIRENGAKSVAKM